MDLAEKFGCQGLMGIHWRHRIMDANAGYQARYSWEKSLSPAEYFQNFRWPRSGVRRQKNSPRSWTRPTATESCFAPLRVRLRTATTKSTNIPATMMRPSNTGTAMNPRRT